MIREVKEFMCPFDYTPTDDDIKEAISLAKKNDCVIRLSWLLKWSGKYDRLVYPNSEFEDIKNSLPKFYGL